MPKNTLLNYGKTALAIAAILALVATVWQVMVFLEINPVLAKDFKSAQRGNLSRTIPLLKQQYRDLRITRGQIRALPQTAKTREDIEAYNEDIQDSKELLDAAKARAKELK